MSDNSPQNHDQPRPTTAPCRGRAQHELLSEEVAALRAASRTRPRAPATSRTACSQLQSSLATMSSQNERLVRTLKEAREQIVTLKGEVDRLAQPPSAYGLVIESYDDAHGRHPHRRPQDAGRGQPVRRPDASCPPGREVMLNEALNVVADLRLRAGRRGRDDQGDPRRRPGARGRPRRRGARLPDRRAPRGRAAPGRRRAHARPPLELRLRAHPQGRGRGPRPRGGPRHRLRGHRRPRRADRADPRRRRAALPAPRPVQASTS